MNNHTLKIVLVLLLSTGFIFPQTALANRVSAWHYDHIINLEASPDLPYRLQEAIIKAKPNTLIALPEGKFLFEDEVLLNTSHVTLRGQGMNKTILSFKGQPSGAQGLLVLADAFTAEDFAIEDTAGDGLRIEGANGVVIRRVRVEWTGGTNEENGAYGLYPVLCNNVLIEESIVRGASDAGIYVGQSNNIVVRSNLAEFNVAGIEIENSTHADVYGNTARHNTGGILVFDLPGLSQSGAYSRVYNNLIENNNTANFAPAGNIVAAVPAGTGLMIMATDYVDVFDNTIRGNKTTGVFIVSYTAIAQLNGLPVPEGFDPLPQSIDIRRNTIRRPLGFYFDGSDASRLIGFLHYVQFLPVAEIIYDGIPAPDGQAMNVCAIENNRGLRPAKFSNLQLANTDTLWFQLFGIPGGPLLTELEPHDCRNDEFAGVTLDPFPPVPEPSEDDYTEEEIAALCGATGNGVNWEAMVVDCPQLSRYRLFDNAGDPREHSSTGFSYDLTTPLFSDYAAKYRTIFLPPGTSARYRASGALDFPVGTVISKTFTFDADLRYPGIDETVVETRLLIRRQHGWVGLPYIWNEEMSEARLALGGGSEAVSFIDLDGNEQTTRYRIPNANQCGSCHNQAEKMVPIGPKARLLNRPGIYVGHNGQNQLLSMRSRGLLEGLPDIDSVPRTPVWNDPGDGSLQARAKAYLDVNCAHCHSGGGRAFATGLLLNEGNPVDVTYGVCKSPVAAGRGSGGLSFDIVPGDSGTSILHYRMVSTDPSIRMPELGRSLVHKEGNQLVAEWIDSLTGTCVASP